MRESPLVLLYYWSWNSIICNSIKTLAYNKVVLLYLIFNFALKYYIEFICVFFLSDLSSINSYQLL